MIWKTPPALGGAWDCPFSEEIALCQKLAASLEKARAGPFMIPKVETDCRIAWLMRRVH
jgi:hypothetical protein